MLQWLRVSAVHRDTGGGRGLPHPDLCAGRVVRAKEVVTLLTLVVGYLPVARADELRLAIRHVLGRLADDRLALGDGPTPGTAGAAGDGVQLLLQLIAGVTVKGEDRALDQQIRGTSSDVAILDTAANSDIIVVYSQSRVEGVWQMSNFFLTFL